MIHNCILCKTKLIPIVYGRLDPDILDMQNKGLLLIGLNEARGANSFCPLCEESYTDFTDLPSDFQDLEIDENHTQNIIFPEQL